MLCCRTIRHWLVIGERRATPETEVIKWRHVTAAWTAVSVSVWSAVCDLVSVCVGRGQVLRDVVAVSIIVVIIIISSSSTIAAFLLYTITIPWTLSSASVRLDSGRITVFISHYWRALIAAFNWFSGEAVKCVTAAERKHAESLNAFETVAFFIAIKWTDIARTAHNTSVCLTRRCL